MSLFENSLNCAIIRPPDSRDGPGGFSFEPNEALPESFRIELSVIQSVWR